MRESLELLNLGKSYLKIRNYDIAMEYFIQTVMQGKGTGMKELYDLGTYFLKQEEYQKAEKCFQVLADRGHGESCMALGMMCEKGLGRRKNQETAFEYYGESFSLGNYMAAYKAGCLMMQDALQIEEVREIAISWFQEAIRGGVYEAYTQIGHLYSEHTSFVGETSRDDHIALSWYLRGAIHGNASALEEAALFFLHGYGTKKDPDRAVTMLKQAACKGRGSAAFQLGRIYERGIGVHKNRKEAIRWYLESFRMGISAGQEEAGRMYYRMGIEAYTQNLDDHREAVSFFQKAASLSYGDAYMELAELAEQEGNRENYLHYLKEGCHLHHEGCYRKLLGWYQDQTISKTLQLFDMIGDMQDVSNRHNQEKWAQYIHAFHEIEPLLLEAGEETRDIQSINMLALLYLQGGEDFGKSGNDFIRITKKSLDIEENEKALQMLWIFYSGNSHLWKGGIFKEIPRKAAFYARKLALKGVKGFSQLLSEYYASGYGLKQNMNKAKEWALREKR